MPNFEVSSSVAPLCIKILRDIPAPTLKEGDQLFYHESISSRQRITIYLPTYTA
jgi:hypothetical protein